MPTALPPRRVLLVDDDDAQLEMLRLWLAHEGHAVTVAVGGVAGLAALARAAFDVIVTDLRMPEISGLDLVQATQAHQPGVPVIVLSGQGTLADALEALREGQIFEFLQKPLRPLDRLSDAIMRATSPTHR